MAKVVKFERPIRWNKLRSDQAERVIRHLAEDTSKVQITRHAYDRVEERAILPADVYRILRSGHVENQPERDENGNWVVTVVGIMPGSREAGVVTAIIGEGDGLIVVTVQWMDMRR